MRMTQRGVEQLKNLEKFSGVPYMDGSEVAIGYGHVVKPGEILPSTITKEVAENYLKADLRWAEDAVNYGVKVPLNPNQFDALVSFVYNIGSGAFRKSTLLSKLNSGTYQLDSEFRKWVYHEGAVSEGLKARREKEIGLFNEPVNLGAIPEIKAMEEENKAPVVIQKPICYSSNFLSINLKDMGKSLFIAILGGAIPSIYDIVSNGALPSVEQLKGAGVIGLVAGFSYLIKNYFQNSCGQVFKKDPPKEPNTLIKLDIGGLLGK